MRQIEVHFGIPETAKHVRAVSQTRLSSFLCSFSVATITYKMQRKPNVPFGLEDFGETLL